ncbi:HAD family hydrolase [Acinetobacter sp. A47]|uniref:HAD family hydrolase n=1 Tax=Acinetobacter sp. A47 TaxID=1561217 RepID=UPI00056F164B|nr:HAD family phosphatase [Acinetobacter sp. A47]
MTQFAVIFDIDGVVVDSEQLHFDALLQVIPDKAQGFHAEQLIGLSLEATLDALAVPKHEQPDTKNRLTDSYNHMLDVRYLRPGIQDFVRFLEQNQVPYGFVSTAPREVCVSNLGLLDMQRELLLISGTDIERTKPYPDPYLEMLTILNADPERTIVVEDTDLGISAAYQAGIKYIYGWPHALSTTQQYGQAIKVIESLDEIKVLHQDGLAAIN